MPVSLHNPLNSGQASDTYTRHQTAGISHQVQPHAVPFFTLLLLMCNVHVHDQSQSRFLRIGLTRVEIVEQIPASCGQFSGCLVLFVFAHSLILQASLTGACDSYASHTAPVNFTSNFDNSSFPDPFLSSFILVTHCLQQSVPRSWCFGNP